MNNFKRRVIRAGARCLGAVAAGMLAAVALGPQAAAQDCPNVRTFGEQLAEARREGETRRVQVQGVYFNSEDKNAFLPEVEGRRWNPVFVTVSTGEFSDRLARLVARGEAAVNGRQKGPLLLGDIAALERGRQPLLQDVSFRDLAPAALEVGQALALDRYTTFSVAHRPDEPFYRVHLLSWFVEVRPDGSGRMTVDIDLGTFLRPGETQIVKFLSDFEVKRTGSARAYLAISLAPLGGESNWSSTQRGGGPARGN
ncbi:MAG: hypothetical protein ACJ74T_15525 [Pyrinomonadaceae bacterium]